MWKKLITEVKVLIQIIPKCFYEYFSLDHRPNKMFIEEKFRKIVCNTFIFYNILVLKSYKTGLKYSGDIIITLRGGKIAA